MAMGRTYDQMPRRHDACGAGFQIGGCARLPLRECVPAWTKAVPSALIDRYREAYRRGAQSRICTTVYRLVRTAQGGWGGGVKTASAGRKSGEPNHLIFKSTPL